MSIKKILLDEKKALSYIDLHTPLSELIQLVQAWDSCAQKAIQIFKPNTSGYLVAIEHNQTIAKQEYETILKNNWVYTLVKCASHHELAKKLYQHSHPIVRTACAKHHDLALILKKDDNEYVRNSCCQWQDILEAIHADPAEIVRNRQISASSKMALYYYENGCIKDQILAITKSHECRTLALNSSNSRLQHYAVLLNSRVGISA